MERALMLWILLVIAPGSGLAAPPPALVTAPSTGPGLVGGLPLDGRAQGSLVASAGGVAFHAYRVELPAGLLRWTLTLDADADLDLAVKFGSAIASYASAERGGDWDRFDVAIGNPTVMVVERPRAGLWYVDVVNPLEPGAWGTYRLSSTVVGGAPADVGLAGTYRCRGSDALLRLRREDDGRLVGALEDADARVRFVLAGVVTAAGGRGVVGSDAGRLGFVATLTPTGLELRLFDVDAAGHAIAGSAWRARFDRVRDDLVP